MMGLSGRWTWRQRGGSLREMLGGRRVPSGLPGSVTEHGAGAGRAAPLRLRRAGDRAEERVQRLVERFDIEPYSDLSAK